MGAAPMDVTSTLASAPAHARAQHGGRSRPETGTADAGSFGAVLSDVQGAPDTPAGRTAGSAGHARTPSADKKASHDSAVQAPDEGPASAGDGTAVNAAAAGAGSSVTAGQTGAPLAAAGPGTPAVLDGPASPAVATTPPTAAVAQPPGPTDPRLSLPGATPAGAGQPATAQQAAAQGSGGQAAGAQTGAAPVGIALPAAAVAKGLSPAEGWTDVPGGASAAPRSDAAQSSPAQSAAAQSSPAQSVAAEPPAGTASMSPASTSPVGAGSAAPNTSPTAVLGAVGGLGAAVVPGTAPGRGVASASRTSATAAEAVGVANASAPGLPGIASVETKPSTGSAADAKTAVDNTAPTPAAASLAAGTAAAAPAGQPPSASVPSAAPPPAPQTAGTLQPQLAKPLFTLAGAPHGQHIMTLKVSPEDLGPLTVRAHIDATGVRIELFASGDAGREAVRGILPELRKELTDAGFGASLDLSDHTGPGGAAQDRAGHGTAGQDGAGRDPGGNNTGGGSRNGSAEPRPGSRWEALADAAVRNARTLNGPQTTLDILV